MTNRYVSRNLIVIVMLSAVTFGLWPASIRADYARAGQALVLLVPGANVDELTEHVRLAGGSVTHLFSGHAFIGYVPVDMPLPDGVLDIYRQPVDLALVSTWPDGARRAAGVWNALLTQPVGSLQGLEAELADDAFDAPPPIEPQSAALTPGYTQTSEFMIGRVAVGIVLPESDGSLDPSVEDWTEQERALALSEIVAALDWWAAREPNAHLSFVYDDGTAAPVSTGYEPITHDISNQRLWISQVMQNKGYTGSSYFDQVRQYNDALRETYDTDWAFTIFCVDSSNDVDNRFADGYFAYAYRYGPFMVMTWGNNGYGPYNMDAVAAHEVGHIFGALDQYAAAQQPCTRQSGYLGVENQNSQYGTCIANEDSIMRGQVWPYMNGAVDDYARGQVGWRDSDGDGILDPVDTTCRITGASYATWADQPNVLTFTGNVQDDPYPSPLRSSVTINKIVRVQYRVDGEPWIDAQAVDGAFDAYAEDFTFTTGLLPTGDLLFEIRVVDSAGNELVQPLVEVQVTDPVDDILDTTLTLLNSAQQEDKSAQADDDRQFVYEGRASSNASFVAEVYYRLDGSAWQPVVSQDGAFDEYTETFSFTIDPAGLAPGQHTVEAYSVDGEGHVETSPASDTFDVESQAFTIFVPLVIR